MTTWIRARVVLSCGSCRAVIANGAVCFEITNAGGRRLRCAACAERDFGARAPDFVESDSIAPQPSLPIDRTRTPDFVRFDRGHAQRVRADVEQRHRDFRERQAND